MKIRGKILLCLLSIFAFLMLTVVTTYLATSRVSYFRQRSIRVEARLLAATALRAQVRNQLLETFDTLYVSGLQGNEARIQKGKEEVQRKFADLKETFVAGNENSSPLTADHDFQALRTAYYALQAVLDQGASHVRSGNQSAARASLKEAREIRFQKEFLKEITAVIETQMNESKVESANLERSILMLRTLLVLSACFALLFAFGIAAFVSRSIGRRLALIEAAALEVAKGNLTVDLNEEGRDEVATLACSINQMASSLKSANENLLKQQELLVMSSKMSSLGEMAGGIAHEINNPLAIIQMRAEQLRDSWNEPAPTQASVNEACEVIIRTTNRVAKIITGLRSFARDGRADPCQPAKLQDIVEDTLSFCQAKFKNKGIPIQVIAPQEKIVFDCRPSQISQVLLNLLGNAFDAVQQQEEKWIQVEARDLGPEVELSVTDSGPGIPPELREKLAQPFFTTKEIGKGTGLGLSISRGIVNSHCGRFAIDASCKNTRFVITLPKKQGARKTAA